MNTIDNGSQGVNGITSPDNQGYISGIATIMPSAN